MIDKRRTSALKAILTGLLVFALPPGLTAAGLSCPAGMPLGSFELTVHRATQNDAGIPLNRINRLEEGDHITYTPVLKAKEKRPGQVTIVLIAAQPQAGDNSDFLVLSPHDADETATWTVPFRSSLALYVYGPAGLSTGKLRGFIGKDQELVAQLADYAEKTAQTETVLQALATYETTGAGEGVQAALSGFAGQFGNATKIDRTAPLDQQTLAAFRTLNPALSTYDPINPAGAHRVAQTAGLATTVAGMFLGSTVGLAAGGTAMALNLKTLLFPDTDFRSAYTQQHEQKFGQTLCSAREAINSRKRRAYLWAVRVPGVPPPAVKIGPENNLVAGLRTPLKLDVPESQTRLIARIRNWALESDRGPAVPVSVTPVADNRSIEVNLRDSKVEPGEYRLTALWDWAPVVADGTVRVSALPSFANVRVSPASAVQLREHSGKQLATLEGADFQFVEKITLVRTGDKYATPAVVPWSLPIGPRRGPQPSLEMQIDTSGLSVGSYTLALSQQGGSVESVEMKVVPPPPVITNLPLAINCGSQDEEITLTGTDLDRITELSAPQATFTLAAASADATTRTARVTTGQKWQAGSATSLQMKVRGYPGPVVLSNALLLAGARPKINAAEPSIPSGLPIALRPGELLAGTYTNLLLRVDADSAVTGVTLHCRDTKGESVRVRPGDSEDRVRMQPAQEGTIFLSVDPGRWSGPCRLTATIETKESGTSRPYDIGTVVRMPTIESFRLTDEAAGEGLYVGVLQGRDLELIEKTGWDARNGQSVSSLPSAIVGEANRQSLRITMPWPSPAPHAPLYIWLRGETEGRATTVRY